MTFRKITLGKLPGFPKHSLNFGIVQAKAGANLKRSLFLRSLVTSGNLQQSTIFGLGVMPYISASIIFQLLTTVMPSLEKLQKEGETGRKKIQEWTRYATVPLCIIQAIFWISYMRSTNPPLVQRYFLRSAPLMVETPPSPAATSEAPGHRSTRTIGRR